MSDLTLKEKRKLEKLFGMGTGYVLNFTDRTFSDFFDEHAKCNINDDVYKEYGSSKAKQLRKFWDIEQNHLVGKVIGEMIIYGEETKYLPDDSDLIADCRKIAKRLLKPNTVAEIDALIQEVDSSDFDRFAQLIRDAIEKNQPEIALDRLHTYLVKYIRKLCKQRGIEFNRDKPLHSIFGEYINHLKKNGHIETEMSVRILKTSISILDAFNHVRNEKSLAHDNHILNYEESLLTFNYIASFVRFIKSIEAKIPQYLIYGLDNTIFYKNNSKETTLNLNYNNKFSPLKLIIKQRHPNGLNIKVYFKSLDNNSVPDINLTNIIPKINGFDDFHELLDGYYLQIGTYKFQDNIDPHILIAVGDSLINLTLLIIEYHPPEHIEDAYRLENWEIIGVSGQEKAIVKNNSIIMPYGSQGLYDEYVFTESGFLYPK
jgi:hypothetical protein